MPELRIYESGDQSAQDDLAGMAGLFNGLALALPFYLALIAAWWWVS